MCPCLLCMCVCISVYGVCMCVCVCVCVCVCMCVCVCVCVCMCVWEGVYIYAKKTPQKTNKKTNKQKPQPTLGYSSLTPSHWAFKNSIGSLKKPHAALGWSWYRDANPVPTSLLADGLATASAPKPVVV